MNLAEITHQPVENVHSLKGVSYHLSTYAYISFLGNQPYNAFIAQNVFAKDSQGRWLFDLVSNSTDNSVYGRYYVARASCWFNLKVNPQEFNSMAVGFSRENSLMLKVQLHQMPKDEKEFILEAPDGSVTRRRADFFFTQALQFLFPYSLLRMRWPMM